MAVGRFSDRLPGADMVFGCREHTVLRAAKARIQLGSYCIRADRPDDPDWVVIHYLARL